MSELKWEEIEKRLDHEGPARISIFNIAKRSIRKNNNMPQYEWSMYIGRSEPDWLVNEIDSITYILDSKFKKNSFVILRSEDPKFRLNGTGWDEFIVELKIKIRDKVVKIYHQFKFSEKGNLTTLDLKF